MGCSAEYSTTQADVDAGAVVNTATVGGVEDGSLLPVESNPSTVTIPAILQPSIALSKSSTTASYSAAGQPIDYSYQVTNTGNDTLSGIVIVDDKILSSAISCSGSSLAPGQSLTLLGSVHDHTV